jgi:hypothetical protein
MTKKGTLTLKKMGKLYETALQSEHDQQIRLDLLGAIEKRLDQELFCKRDALILLKVLNDIAIENV